MAALRTYPAARSARAFQRRAPRVLCSSATASSAAPAGISSEFTASYLRLRSSLSCLIVRPCSHESRPPELPRLSAPFYKFDRRHVAVRLSQGNVARRSLAPWMLVLLSNPGALWHPAATTCGVSIRTVVLICSCSAVSSRRAPRVCLASALRAYVRVAPARSARTISQCLCL